MTRYIGAHLSVAKGFVPAVQNAIDKGGNALQIFSGSPRSWWGRKPVDEIQVDEFLKFRDEKKFGPVFIHAMYLINLTGNNDALIQNSINAITYDLQYCSRIKASGVVVHLGSHLGAGYDAVFEVLAERIAQILDNTPADSTLLVENSAGQNGKLCSSIEDLGRLFGKLEKYVKAERLGLCIDTCHAFCAGYHLTELGAKLKEANLLDNVKLIHVNDARDPFDGGRDRHANIGEGEIGREEFKVFLTDPQFAKFPLILEVPGFDDNGPDARNIEIVKELIG